MCHRALIPEASPDLAREGEQVIQIIRQAARRLAGPDEAEDLTLAAVAVAQGFALLSTSTSVTSGTSTAKMAARVQGAHHGPRPPRLANPGGHCCTERLSDHGDAHLPPMITFRGAGGFAQGVRIPRR
jgi:hypothetical protein